MDPGHPRGSPIGVIATDPASPALIAFTSGTTRDPKGVIHSHQTLGFETRQRLKPGHPAPAMGEMRAHFEQSGLARQKWPEELHAVEDFPRTPSGKVQKFILRRDIAARGIRE